MRRPDTNVAGAVAGAGGTAHRPELASRGQFETATAAVTQAERLGLEVHAVSQRLGGKDRANGVHRQAQTASASASAVACIARVKRLPVQPESNQG